jgi:hypothetical protein
MLIFPIVLASLWCAVATELVLESARSGGRALVFFGRVLAAPPPGAEVLILCAISASAGLAIAIAVAHGRGRMLERRMAEQLDARWAELAEREVADKARKDLLSWRIAELHSLVDELLAERRAAPARHLVIVPDLAEHGNGDGKADGASPASSPGRPRR